MYAIIIVAYAELLLCMAYAVNIENDVLKMILVFIHNQSWQDSISRDGPDTPIYVIHNKKLCSSVSTNF